MSNPVNKRHLLAASGGLVLVAIAAALPGPGSDPHSTERIATVAVLKNVAEAQRIFHNRENRYGTFEDLVKADALGQHYLTGRSRYGYRFAMEADNDTWRCVAWPAEPGATDRPSFFVDEARAIHAATGYSGGNVPPIRAGWKLLESLD